MAVAFITQHRTRVVGDVIKSLGEEHGPAAAFLSSHRLVDSLAFRFTAKAFRAFPKTLTTSFPVRSNQQAFHKIVTCRTASVSASNDAFTWDDVGRISKTVQISGATRKRSKSAIALSLESHSEFLPFVIEDHSQRVSSNSVN
ncbi:unnamed protein product [Prunus armeniaca]